MVLKRATNVAIRQQTIAMVNGYFWILISSIAPIGCISSVSYLPKLTVYNTEEELECNDGQQQRGGPHLCTLLNSVTMAKAIDHRDLKIVEQLGEGSYGTVYKAVYNNIIVAAKEVRKAGCCEDELMFLEKFDHRYVTKLVGTCCAANGNTVIVTDYEDSFTLKRVFRSRFSKTCISDPFKIAISYHICKGLEYIHSMAVYHGDIKPDNILLNTSYVAKICDLGMCGYEGHTKKKGIGTECWNAREKIDYNLGGTDNYCGYASDMYSFGLVILYMFTDFDPEVIDIGRIADYIKLADVNIGNIIGECIMEPNKRPSAMQVSAVLQKMIVALPLHTGEGYFLRNPIEPEQHEMSDLNRSMSVAQEYITFGNQDCLVYNKAKECWNNRKYLEAITSLQNMSDTHRWVYYLYKGTAFFDNLLPGSVMDSVKHWEKARKYNVPCILNRLYLCYKYLCANTNTRRLGGVLNDLLTTSLEKSLYPNVELLVYWGVDSIESAIEKRGVDLKIYITNVLKESSDIRARLLYARLMQFNMTVSNKDTDLKDAISEYRELLRKHPTVAVKMRLCFSYQRYGDWKSSFVLCRKLADEHVPYAQVELGRMYNQGIGCEQSDSNALKCTEIAAKNGFVEAVFELGIYSSCNKDIDIDYAEELFTRGAERGHLESMIMLADMLAACNKSNEVWKDKVLLCKDRNPNMFNMLNDVYKDIVNKW